MAALEPLPDLGPPPQVSVRTVQMAGLLVDVYGLADLPAGTTHVSCLWLHHPRTRARGDMAGVAARCVGAWNASLSSPPSSSSSSPSSSSSSPSPSSHPSSASSSARGLIALAYDQRNHGSRLVDERANTSWREGNAMHAVDMWGVVEGMVADQRVLLDVVEGYLFSDAERRIKVDQHLALGVSLGGHSVWQLMFAEPRVTAGVVVIGCPDYMRLLSDRARLSKLSTYSAQDDGATFLGSRHFPPSLVEACQKFDPKAIFFGTSAVPDARVTGPGPAEDAARQILRERLRGKRFLLCSGGDDKLVPYRCSEPFLQWFKQATGQWFTEEDVSVDDRVYPGVGHSFSADMVSDSVRFIVDAVARAVQKGSGGNDELRASKI